MRASAHARSIAGVRTYFSHTPIDLVIVRENTESLYFGCEFEQGKPETAELIADIKRLNGKTVRPDSGITIKAISITGTRRIVKYAFEYARKHKRKKVTSVHKANILKYTDGLFLEVSREVAKEYPDIEFEDRIVDNMCMQLVQKPELYDVLVLPNLYGDILSDLCAGLVGGLGVAPGANIGEAGAVFEATHGSAPKYKGLYKMNPTALILSGVLMLEHLGETDAARPAGKGRGQGDQGRQGRDLRHEAASRRSDGRRHARDGQGDQSRDGSGCLSRFDRTAYLRLIRGQTRGLWPHAVHAPACGWRRGGLWGGRGRPQRRIRPRMDPDPPRGRSGGFDRQSHSGRNRQNAHGRVGRPLVPPTGRPRRDSEPGLRAGEGLNDEGRVLEENLPDVPHLQDPDRVALARHRHPRAGERADRPR